MSDWEEREEEFCARLEALVAAMRMMGCECELRVCQDGWAPVWQATVRLYCPSEPVRTTAGFLSRRP